MAEGKRKLQGLSRELMALRVANELEDGIYVNLGIGIPTLASNWIEGRDIILQAELGMLNTGPLSAAENIDQDLINASCQPVTELPGTCYFSDCESFAMIEGGIWMLLCSVPYKFQRRETWLGGTTPLGGYQRILAT